ncbi:MAG: hypothetical protein ACLFU0_09665, partial [Alphaproteobacteria bacterium]
MPLSEQQRVDPRQVGLIDIGSNSVRFVVYDAVARAPMLKFNEKAMCALGRGLKVDGNLGDAEMAATMKALTRYLGLVRAMGLEALDVFATEAVRAAANGPAFVAEIEQRLGVKVAVLTGEAESRYAGLGVVSHFPDAHGIAGDLGGASLELCEVHPAEGGDGEVGHAVTFPFGPLRKPEKLARKGDLGAVEQPIRAAFPGGAAGGDFYAVGGAWRAFAKLAMARLDHGFRIVEGYALDAATARAIAEDVARRGELTPEDRLHVSKRRQDTLPSAAFVLAGVVRALAPARVVFSAGGVRMVNATSWSNGTTQVGWFGTVQLGGDLTDTVLSATDRDNLGYSLGTLNVRGNVTDTTLTVPHGVRMLSANDWTGTGTI